VGVRRYEGNTGRGDFDPRTNRYQIPDVAKSYEFTASKCGEITFPIVITAHRDASMPQVGDFGVENETIRIECPTEQSKPRIVSMRVYNNGKVTAPGKPGEKNYIGISFSFSVKTTCLGKRNSSR
jgi:hypothetical protein